MFEMVMARAAAIACGHKDAIDLDRLRHDPLMEVAFTFPLVSSASYHPYSRHTRSHKATDACRADQGGPAQWSRIKFRSA
jgi:hypothetical protein